MTLIFYSVVVCSRYIFVLLLGTWKQSVSTSIGCFLWVVILYHKNHLIIILSLRYLELSSVELLVVHLLCSLLVFSCVFPSS